MSIVPVAKITLCGLEREKVEVLAALQDLGCLHLVPLRAAAPEERPAAPRAEDTHRALRHLLDAPERRRQLRQEAGFEVEPVVAQVLANKQRLREVGDRRDFLEARIRNLEPWGDFALPPLDELAGHRLWFYVVPLRQMAVLERLALPWQLLHASHKDCYVAVIAPDEPPPGALPVARIHTGSKALSTLHRELEEVELELEDLAAERVALTRYVYLIVKNLARAEDHAALAHATEQTFDDEGVFAVQGWVPEPEAARVRAFAAQRKLAWMLEPPAPDEQPPTLLRTPPELAAGEDLANFYQTPSAREWDPSTVLFFSFALFFAMILSDAGYALTLLVLLLAYWRWIGASERGGRLRVLGLAMVGAALAYGVLVGSYFGMAPPETSLLARLAVLEVDDFDTMMRLSVGVGVLHVALANAIAAWHAWGRPTAIGRLGWIVALVGGVMVWLGQDGDGQAETIGRLGLYALAGGLLLVFAFASDRPRSSIRSLLWRALDGLRALTGITRLFGDVLSYLRLFALGLASASLALTFNDLAAQVRHALPGMGLLFEILILVVGHALNLGLAVMSGVVHGLRLNFIEFYNWGLSEEGYPFKAFARREARPWTVS